MMILALRPNSSGGISEPLRPTGGPRTKEVFRDSGWGLFSLLISILGASGFLGSSGFLISGILGLSWGTIYF